MLRDLRIPLAIGTDPGIVEAMTKHIASEEPAVAEALRSLTLGRPQHAHRRDTPQDPARVQVAIQDRTDGMTYVLSLAGVPTVGDVLVVRHPSGGVSLWALRVLEVGANGACVAERSGGAECAHAIFDAHPVGRWHEKEFA